MAKVACSAKALEVLNYLKTLDLEKEPKTLNDLASELGMEARSLNGVLNAGLQKKGYITRTPAQIETQDEEGNLMYKSVNFIKLTDEGKAYDHETAVKTDAQNAAAAALAQ